LFGFDEARGSPAEDHRAALPMGDASRSLPNAAIRRVDQVRGTQAASQRSGKLQTVHGEHFVQPFTYAGRGAGPLALEPLGVLPQLGDSFLVVELPGGFERGARLVVLFFGQMPQDIAELVL